MFISKMGTWSVYCESDSRWNKSGRADGFVSNGGPPEMFAWISYCEKEYGQVPADATKSFMKD